MSVLPSAEKKRRNDPGPDVLGRGERQTAGLRVPSHIAGITGLAASRTLLVHGGGTSTITVAGNNLSGQTVTVTAFDGAAPTAVTTSRSGAGTVTLNFPATPAPRTIRCTLSRPAWTAALGPPP